MKLLPEIIAILKSIQDPHADKVRRKSLLLILVLLVALLYPILQPQQALATNLALAYYRPDRLKAGTAAAGGVSGSVCAKTATVGTETTLTFVVPSGWTLDSTASTFTMDTSATNIPTGTTQWPSTGSGNAASVNNGTHTLTFTVGDLSSSTTTYCMHFTASGTTTASVTGDNQTGSIATDVDAATNYAVSQVSNDQIAVTATVNPTFTFALSANAAALGTLTPDTVSSATTITESIGTNAGNGWITWAKGAQANGLHSTTANADISGVGTAGTTVTDLNTGGTYGYGLGVAVQTNGSGTAAANSGYDSTSSTTKVGKLSSSTFFPIGSGGATNSDVLNLMVRAKVGSSQKAASDYADTITITAAGQF